jgi:hypothetical protein
VARQHRLVHGESPLRTPPRCMPALLPQPSRRTPSRGSRTSPPRPRSPASPLRTARTPGCCTSPASRHMSLRMLLGWSYMAQPSPRGSLADRPLRETSTQPPATTSTARDSRNNVRSRLNCRRWRARSAGGDVASVRQLACGELRGNLRESAEVEGVGHIVTITPFRTFGNDVFW